MTRLEIFLRLLEKWNRSINLVGKSTLEDPWRRHFLDSAQLLDFLPKGPAAILDIGSGAGFPGLVLAMLGEGRLSVHLCESDGRKATFLREAARLTATAVTVHNQRIEELERLSAYVITARALAPIAKILDLCADFLESRTQLLLLKGAQAHNELTDAEKNWNITATLHHSRSDTSGFIVAITQAHRHDRPVASGGSS
jgi:16S rRNA (guanine527-N7)-methyltransferase